MLELLIELCEERLVPSDDCDDGSDPSLPPDLREDASLPCDVGGANGSSELSDDGGRNLQWLLHPLSGEGL